MSWKGRMKERSAADAAALLSFPALEQTETGVDTVAQPIASTNPEKFIPVDRSDIVQRVLDKCFEPDQKQLAEEVVRYMCALRQVEFGKVARRARRGLRRLQPGR